MKILKYIYHLARIIGMELRALWAEGGCNTIEWHCLLFDIRFRSIWMDIVTVSLDSNVETHE
jgi:hypothetical protein